MARSSSRINRLKQREKESAEITMTAGSALASPYQPLSQDAVEKIHKAALQLLAEIGMAKATPRVLETALANGCELSDTGRLMFPNAVIEHTLKVAAKNFVMHGRDASYDFVAKNDRINFCTGGAAVTMLDIAVRSLGRWFGLFRQTPLLHSLGH